MWDQLLCYDLGSFKICGTENGKSCQSSSIRNAAVRPFYVLVLQLGSHLEFSEENFILRKGSIQWHLTHSNSKFPVMFVPYCLHISNRCLCPQSYWACTGSCILAGQACSLIHTRKQVLRKLGLPSHILAQWMSDLGNFPGISDITSHI